jgi:hypothetical protein
MEVSGLLKALAALFPADRGPSPSTHWIGGLDMSTVSLSMITNRKIPALAYNRIPVIQPIVNYAALFVLEYLYLF